MQARGRIGPLIITILILIFSIIHLGVGGGIISTYRYYGGLFSAERGLAGFNVFIGVVGFLIGILALFTVLSGRTVLSKSFVSIMTMDLPPGTLRSYFRSNSLDRILRLGRSLLDCSHCCLVSQFTCHRTC